MVDFKKLASQLSQSELVRKFRLVNGTIHAGDCKCQVCRAVSYDEWERDAFTDSEGRRTLHPKEALHGTDPFDLTEEEKKYNDMIAVTRSNATQGSTTARGVQFLGPRHVTNPDGFVVQIIAVTTDEPDNFGNPYVVYFQRGVDKYSKGFKPTSHLLISLVDMLGEDESKWIGQQVRVSKHTDKKTGAEQLVFSKARK